MASEEVVIRWAEGPVDLGEVVATLMEMAIDKATSSVDRQIEELLRGVLRTDQQIE
jgi:hypothetical protein